MKIMTKRDQIILFVRSRGIPVSKSEIVEKFDDYYANGDLYIGQILSRAVDSGLLQRPKRGYYIIGEGKKEKKSYNPDQTQLF